MHRIQHSRSILAVQIFFKVQRLSRTHPTFAIHLINIHYYTRCSTVPSRTEIISHGKEGHVG